jgi:glycosyltransferase involved in cell wall biosynthesis
MMYEAGMQPPDIIGPITRSPLKNYGGWKAPYTADWFYSARVIRLNYNEERKHKEKVTLIVHGVDTDVLQPYTRTNKTRILWAGQAGRPAKNHDLWLEIQQQPAPVGYEYHTLSKYAIQDYWRELSKAAVVVCTSLYESFCNAAFEALSCGVPVVWQKGLHGKRTRSSVALWEDAGIRCEYTAEGFHDGIQQALAMNEQQRLGMRQYVLDHCSLRHMRDSYVKVFSEVLNAKKV